MKNKDKLSRTLGWLVSRKQMGVKTNCTEKRKWGMVRLQIQYMAV